MDSVHTNSRIVGCEFSDHRGRGRSGASKAQSGDLDKFKTVDLLVPDGNALSDFAPSLVAYSLDDIRADPLTVHARPGSRSLLVEICEDFAGHFLELLGFGIRFDH